MTKREYQTVQIPTAEHDKHDSNFDSGDEAWVYSFNPGRQTQNDKLGSSPIVPQKNHKHKEGFLFVCLFFLPIREHFTHTRTTS